MLKGGEERERICSRLGGQRSTEILVMEKMEKVTIGNKNRGEVVCTDHESFYRIIRNI